MSVENNQNWKDASEILFLTVIFTVLIIKWTFIQTNSRVGRPAERQTRLKHYGELVKENVVFIVESDCLFVSSSLKGGL